MFRMNQEFRSLDVPGVIKGSTGKRGTDPDMADMYPVHWYLESLELDPAWRLAVWTFSAALLLSIWT